MKHLLMDPAFPDLVAQASSTGPANAERHRVGNPRHQDVDRATDAFLTFLGKLEVASTRLW